MDSEKRSQITRDQRIAIIGAGAAGLTAAETLKDRGYTNVVLFERAAQAGGKCCTIDIAGKNYELGAGVLSENNRVPLRLARKYNVPLTQAEFGRSILVDGVTGQLRPQVNPLKKMQMISQLMFRYRRLFQQYPILNRPGHVGVPSELTVPYTEFSQAEGIEAITDFLELFSTGYGYGYLNEVPASYILKYYHWEAVVAFVKKQLYQFPEGIQHLWTRVAQEHDVRYNTTIQKIERGERVQITTAEGTEVFDSLIIASPLDEAVQFLDATPEEAELFSKIQYVDYRTVAVTLSNFPKQSGYVPSNYSRERAGHPVFWYHRYVNEPIYTFYALPENNESDEAVTEKVRALVEVMGGSIEQVHTVRQWKYFPHVTSADMRAGFYDRLESLQGTNHTYYVGEVMNFSCVGLTADYAADLVERRTLAA
jgi:hypothetical protein